MKGGISYPEGFTIENCVIISCEFTYVMGTEAYLFPYVGNNTPTQYVQKNRNNVLVYVNSNTFAGKTFTVTFMRLE